MYTTKGLDRELRQGEVISGLRQPIYDGAKGGTFLRRIPYSIILAHDCDLVLDYNARAKGGPGSMNELLIYEMETETEARSLVDGKAKINTGLWRSVEKNDHVRYHCIEGAPTTLDLDGVGLPLLVIDFKRYFTVTAAEIERQLLLKEDGARRRARLDSPYREGLQVRAAFYFQRIVLPDRPIEGAHPGA
jgi:hypothetical protein